MRERDGKGSAASGLAPVSPAPLVELVLDSLASPHSRRAYRRALGEFFAWYPSNASGEGFTRATVQRYRSHLADRKLSAASINLALAVLCKLASEAAAAIQLRPSLPPSSVPPRQDGTQTATACTSSSSRPGPAAGSSGSSFAVAAVNSDSAPLRSSRC